MKDNQPGSPDHPDPQLEALETPRKLVLGLAGTLVTIGVLMLCKRRNNGRDAGSD